MKEDQRSNHSDFREQFETSPRFGALINSTHAFLARNHPIPSEQFFQSFAGRLFEELAYLKYLEAIGHTNTLLDPHATLDYFLDLYGDALPAQTFLQESIMGRYVPDGILLRQDATSGPVVKILEYTAQSENRNLRDYIQKKEEHVGMLRKRQPAIFRSSSLVIIFTKDVHSALKDQRVSDGRTTLTSVPYSHGSVHKYARNLIGTHFSQPK